MDKKRKIDDVTSASGSGLEKMKKQNSRPHQDDHVTEGQVVWARYGRQNWLPAIVVNNIVRRDAVKNHVWVFWLTDSTLTLIRASHVEPFWVRFQEHSAQFRKSSFVQKAIADGLMICAERVGTDPKQFTDISRQWATDSQIGFLAPGCVQKCQPDPEFPYPDVILRVLNCQHDGGHKAQGIDNDNKVDIGDKQEGTWDQSSTAVTVDSTQVRSDSEICHQESSDSSVFSSRVLRSKRMSDKGGTGSTVDSAEVGRGPEMCDQESADSSVCSSRVLRSKRMSDKGGTGSTVDSAEVERGPEMCDQESADSSACSSRVLRSKRMSDKGGTGSTVDSAEVERGPEMCDQESADSSVCSSRVFRSKEMSDKGGTGSTVDSAEVERGPEMCDQESADSSVCSSRVFRSKEMSDKGGTGSTVDSAEVERGQEIFDQGYAGNSTEHLADRYCCMACSHETYNTVDHPLFEGQLCIPCKEFWKSSYYAVDYDECKLFCVICCEQGELFVCDNSSCGHCYCSDCVERYTGPETSQRIRDSRSWECFLCTDYSLESHGRLKPRQDWRSQIVCMYCVGPLPICDLRYLTDARKRNIRVLSLFDGIGTGRVALEQLGLQIEAYFASEIYRPAVIAARANHAEIINIGNVKKLNRKKLQNLCPIDLVIGGPPCNDLSMVNHQRKGFDGTGKLVIYYAYVLKLVQSLCRHSNHVFWLMENTRHMLKTDRQVITDLLKTEPVVWDAKDFSGHQRARLFWGNLPGMLSTADVCRQLEEKRTDLQSALCHGRTALVSHTRTITTNMNSLSRRPGTKGGLVMQQGEDVTLASVEIEQLFGFPAHYTDYGNFGFRVRQKLLGKSWSVPVIKHLLSPLVQYFQTEGQ